ncbi:RNA recognition motif-containing protein [Toxoplasma gondii TgCatPRC2]|uniref:RNA recognition motif-containing protein n=1 Tax=Toxoplasma gondii TgCatPRC2 TaxID=1130821 RepID=A0A151H412_TOXGO|nr:RNA recognition motif-containing protein [Toxoplasma gondii TgCatPRC2]
MATTSLEEEEYMEGERDEGWGEAGEQREGRLVVAQSRSVSRERELHAASFPVEYDGEDDSPYLQASERVASKRDEGDPEESDVDHEREERDACYGWESEKEGRPEAPDEGSAASRDEDAEARDDGEGGRQEGREEDVGENEGEETAEDLEETRRDDEDSLTICGEKGNDSDPIDERMSHSRSGGSGEDLGLLRFWNARCAVRGTKQSAECKLRGCKGRAYLNISSDASVAGTVALGLVVSEDCAQSVYSRTAASSIPRFLGCGTGERRTRRHSREDREEADGGRWRGGDTGREQRVAARPGRARETKRETCFHGEWPCPRVKETVLHRLLSSLFSLLFRQSFRRKHSSRGARTERRANLWRVREAQRDQDLQAFSPPDL